MKPFYSERYLRMVCAAEARGFLKTIFLLEDIDCGLVSADFKNVDFNEPSPDRLKTVFRCCVSIRYSDGEADRYIVCGTIGHGGIDCNSIITDDGNGVLIYWDDGFGRHEDHLQTVKKRREQRKKQKAAGMKKETT